MSTTQPIRKQEELDQFKEYYLRVRPNFRNHLMIALGLNTALRISDVLALKYEDLYDFDKGELRMHLTVTEGKTGKRNVIRLNDSVKKAFYLFAGKRPKKKLQGQWVFQGRKHGDEPLSRFQAYRIVKEAAAYAGYTEHVSCHSLRKTFGYHAWKQGIPPALLMEIYNHSSYQITKRYLGIDQDEKDEVYVNIKL